LFLSKGCIDGGMKIKTSIALDDKVYDGSEISRYASIIKSDAEKYRKQFGKYIKDSVNIDDLQKLFNEVKNKINE